MAIVMSGISYFFISNRCPAGFRIRKDILIGKIKHLIDLFKTKSINELKEYMDQHYKDWAKKYNLENPRMTLDENMIRLAQNKL